MVCAISVMKYAVVGNVPMCSMGVDGLYNISIGIGYIPIWCCCTAGIKVMKSFVPSRQHTFSVVCIDRDSTQAVKSTIITIHFNLVHICEVKISKQGNW